MGGQTLNFSEDDLVLTAATYTLAGRKAPLYLGHQPDNTPSVGTVQSLTVKNSALVATADVSDQLTQLVKDAAFKKVSASFFTPGRPENPYPAAWTLRHVAFLGAHPPAVKSLKPLAFAEFAEAQCFDFSEPPLNLLPRHFNIYTYHRIAVELQAINPGLAYENALSIAQASNAFQEHP